MMDGPAQSPEELTLNRLVSELSLEERNSFLEKLRRQSTLSYEPLYESAEETEQKGIFRERYVRLPWYVRFRYFLLSILKSKPPAKVFEESHVNSLGRKITDEAPGVYDHQRSMLLLRSHELLTGLKDAARFFYTALDVSVNRDRAGFYAFLASLEMGEVHRRLETETIPELFTDKLEISERELRQASLSAMEDVFSAISDTERNAMYFNARSLNCLKELSAFGFDHLLMSFGSTTGGQTCPINAIRDSLVILNNILYSLKDPPTLSLLESLFIYRLQERSGEPGFDTNGEMHSLLGMAEEAISTIRSFNKLFPLNNILCCSFRDMSYAPQQISGGEDWFAIYREYWKKQVESKVSDYIRLRKHRELLNSFRYFLKGANLKILKNVISASNPGGLPVPEAFALSFLRTFHAAVFLGDLNVYLRPILIEGEFFKKENRAEYTEAYESIMKIEDEIEQFDVKISPAGEYGRQYAQAKGEVAALPIKSRRMQVVLDAVSHEAGEIIQYTSNAMTSLINVLGGIIKKEAGGKYDTVANFDKLAGKTPDVFTAGIIESIERFQQALRTLKDIEALKNMR
jgi:hypothetical protein